MHIEKLLLEQTNQYLALLIYMNSTVLLTPVITVSIGSKLVYHITGHLYSMINIFIFSLLSHINDGLLPFLHFHESDL